MALSEQQIAATITAERLKKFAPDISAPISAALVRDCPKVFSQKGIDTPVRIAHFFAQVMRETGGLRRLDENMNYSKVERLKKIWKKFREMTDEQCKPYTGNPEKLAKFIYAGRNGNGDEASGDGWTYRGSGLIQLTGRGNFKTVGDEIGIDIVSAPESVRSPDSCVRVAVAYWTTRKINDVAVDSDAGVNAVTKLVNPAEEEGGRAERRAFYNKARGIFT